MKKAYLGIDIGSISTKGVVIDENNNIVETIIGFSDQNKTSLETSNKYLK